MTDTSDATPRPDDMPEMAERVARAIAASFAQPDEFWEHWMPQAEGAVQACFSALAERARAPDPSASAWQPSELFIENMAKVMFEEGRYLKNPETGEVWQWEELAPGSRSEWLRKAGAAIPSIAAAITSAETAARQSALEEAAHFAATHYDVDGGKCLDRGFARTDSGVVKGILALAGQPPSVPVDDGAFGSLISFLIGAAFQRIETLNPDADHRFYLECKLCGGTDQLRPVKGSRPSTDGVQHGGACTLAQYLPRLRAMAAPPAENKTNG